MKMVNVDRKCKEWLATNEDLARIKGKNLLINYKKS